VGSALVERPQIDHPWEILAGAADIIENFGLHKGSYWKGFDFLYSYTAPPDVPCCVLGALSAVADEDPRLPNRKDIVRAAELFLHYAIVYDPEGDVGTADWNDNPDRTAEQVVATLRDLASQMFEQDQGE
jgi:hypothetical protein